MSNEATALLVDNVQTRARFATAQFRAVAHMVDTLRTMLSGDAGVDELGKRVEQLVVDFGNLTTMVPSPAAFSQKLSSVETAVSALERDALAIDGEIPSAWFYDALVANKFTPGAIADYAAVLGRVANDDLSRLDRVQQLLTAMVMQSLPLADVRNGDPRLTRLLEEALPPSNVDATTRAAALEVFAKATEQARTFTSASELTRSTFFLDLRGHRISLRSQILDPAIMAGVVQLETNIEAMLERLRPTDRIGDDTISRHIEEVDEKLATLFKGLRRDDADVLERFKRRLARMQSAQSPASAPAQFDFPTASPKKKSNAYRNVLAALMLVGIGYWVNVALASKPMVELTNAETQFLSPFVESAVVSRDGRHLMATMNAAKWSTLGSADKKIAVEGLAARLGERGYLSATVLMGEEVVVRMDKGVTLMIR